MPSSSQLEAPALLETLFDQLPDSVYLIDPHSSRILYCNRAAHAVLGYEAAEILDHSVLSLQKDVVGAEQWQAIAAEIRKSDPYVFVGRHRHRDGHELAVEVYTRCFALDGRDYFLSVARDITARLALERDMADRDAQLRFALNEATDGLWDWNLDGDEVFFSPQLKRMLGYGPQEMPPVVDTWRDNIHPEDAGWVLKVMQDHLAGQRERYEAEYRLRNRNGHYLWVHDRGRVCERDPRGKPLRVVGMVQNITDRKNLERRLQRLASHDSLTGLLNRRESEIVLDTQLQLCRRMGIQLGICLFDIDHFKNINDLHGHLVGDRVLARIAELIAGHVRAADYLFRWGGEEFMLVCTDTTADALAGLAEKLRTAVAEAHWGETGGLQQVTASFGLALFPQHGDDSRTLFIAADSALYRAKSAGRNRVEMAGPETGARPAAR
jgi:diguanylate cyclase (GGDEF)-like protein/PAS domain S-box-containing protein